MRLLGPPESRIDGAPLRFDTRKAVAILALLAAEARPFGRDELAALLWPESDDAAARGALRRTLSTMRAALDPAVLRIDRSRVELERDVLHVDLADVERAAGSADRQVLAAAAAQVRGPFMAGFHLRDSPEFDDWQAAKAVSVERTVFRLLDSLTEAAVADGDLAGAIAAAERRLDLDPLDESGHVRLMELLAAAGDRPSALRQYRACVAILARELAVSPLVSTTLRYEAIRDAAPDERAPVTAATIRPESAAPGPTTSTERRPLVARQAAFRLLREAHAAAVSDGGRSVVILGEAGIGKTHLAEAFVREARERGAITIAARAHPGEQGIAYAVVVELLRDGAARPDAATRLDRLSPDTRGELGRLVPALRPPASTQRPLAGPGAQARLMRALTDGLTALVAGPTRGVIWIDDLQWADGASVEVIEYLVRRLTDQPVLLLLAWREEDLDDAAIPATRRLAARPATVISLDRLDRDAIADLVATLVPEAAPDADLIGRLAEASEGLPLYIVEALAAGPRTVGPMPVGVRSVLRERLASVDEAASQVLTAASVIGRSFDLATVRQASGRSEEETVDALDAALRRGLIREDGNAFDFAHGALRDLAYGSMSLARRRLLHRRVADALRLDASWGRDDPARLALLAVHERDGGRSDAAAEAFRLAGERSATLFANRQAIEHFGAALALGHAARSAIHAAIGRLHTRLGDYGMAIASLEAAAATAAPVALPELEQAIGVAHARRGDLVAAERHLSAALVDAPDGAFAAQVLVDLAVVRRRMRDAAGAREAAVTAMTRATDAGAASTVGAAHRVLGLVALDAGEHAAAREAATHAVTAALEDPDPTARIGALICLAMVDGAIGSIDAAVGSASDALAICRQIGDRHLEGAVENHLADILHRAGRPTEALEHLRRSVEAFVEVGGRPDDPDPGIWMLSAS